MERRRMTVGGAIVFYSAQILVIALKLCYNNQNAKKEELMINRKNVQLGTVRSCIRELFEYGKSAKPK